VVGEGPWAVVGEGPWAVQSEGPWAVHSEGPWRSSGVPSEGPCMYKCLVSYVFLLVQSSGSTSAGNL